MGEEIAILSNDIHVSDLSRQLFVSLVTLAQLFVNLVQLEQLPCSGPMTHTCIIVSVSSHC